MPTHELNCVPPNVNKYTIQGDALNLLKNKNDVLEKKTIFAIKNFYLNGF